MVWKFMTDFENYPTWHKGIFEAKKTSEGPTGVGTTVEAVAELLGRHKIKLMITDYQPSRRIAWRIDVRPVTGAAGYAAGCRFESLQGGTRVFKFIEGELAGSFRLLEPIINRPMRLEIETDLGIATRLVETKAP
jgi:hypothetical protein